MKIDFRYYLQIRIQLMTFLVFLAALVLVRLGFWQVERYLWRQNFNNHYEFQTNLPITDLDSILTESLEQMEYRKVKVSGIFDNAHSIVRLNQYHDSELGYSLMTPLIMPNGNAVMIDRGWIPAEGNSAGADWNKYAIINKVEITGVIRKSINVDRNILIERPEFWIDFDYDQIKNLYPYRLLPIFIQAIPAEERGSPPIPKIITVELTDGPHIGYAVQWFTFALLLLIGYPFFLKTLETNKNAYE